MTKVLIVDDALFMRIWVRRILAAGDYEVLEAETGREAIRRYAESSPDLVLMDITMPDMDGISAVREIMRQYPGARVIMCSAMGQPRLVADAIRAGALDFIVKPFRAERVLQALEKALVA